MSIFPSVSRRAVVLAVFLAAAAVAGAAHSLPPNFPAAIQLPASARGEAAISALGKRLPEVAAFYRQTPEELAARFRADNSLWADAQGQLYFACEFLADTNAAAATVESAIGPTDPAPFPTSDTFLLHSYPGANRVIYLDFTGHADTSGKWAAGAAEPPFDLDGDTNSFSSSERDRIVYIWQRVAEDYSMYQIDVTTEDPGIEALRKSNAADQNYGVRVVIGGSSLDWYGSAVGGVAFVGSFDDSTDTPCWVFPKQLSNSEKNIAEAASHEAGHTLGLSHDGTSTAGYYSGQGNWAPIMGVGYSKPIVQWSKGEYTDANNTQDDLAVMLNNGAVYRTDDHGNTAATATILTTGSTNGVIERNTDIDYFRFIASGGSVTITVSRPPRDSNLHMQVILYDSGGAPILTNTPADSSTSGTQSAVNTLTLAAGTYYVSVAGTGNGDPLTTGYSSYASLGQYNIAVTGAAAAGPVWVPTAAGTYSWTNLPNWTAPPPNANGGIALVNNNIIGNQTINVPGPITLGTLLLGDANDTHTFTLQSTNGGAFTFTNGAVAAVVNKLSGLNDVINLPLTLAGSLTINHTAGGTLTFSNAISGAGALTKTGAGTTVLAGTGVYAGGTTLSNGVLRLNKSNALSASSLIIAGGVLGLGAGDFTSRTIGTVAGQVRWSGDGGFAAYGAERTVQFSASSINWTAANFIGSGTTLVLGATDADATLNWQQAISLAGAERTIQVESGSAAIDAKITANLAGGTAGTYVNHFTKTGNGTLAVTIQPTYYGDTTVAAGRLMLGDGTGNTGGVSQNTTNISVTSGATLAVNRTGTLTQGSGALPVAISGEGEFAQVGAGTTVLTLANSYTGPTTVSGGTLEFNGGATGSSSLIVNNALGLNSTLLFSGGNFTAGGTAGTQNLTVFTNGNVIINGPANVTFPGFVALGASAASAATLTLSGGTLNVNGADAGSYNNSRALVLAEWSGATNVFTMTGGTLNVTNGRVYVGWTGTGIWNMYGGTANVANLQLNQSGSSASGSTFTLTNGQVNLGSGGIGSVGGANYFIFLGGGTLGSLASWSTTNNATLTNLNGSVTFAPASGQTITWGGILSGTTGGLNMAGPGTLTLTNNNTFTGNLTVNGGTLIAGGGGAGATAPLGNVTSATGRTITINAGAKLTTTINNVTGGTPSANTPAITINGGTLEAQRYGASGNSATANGLTLANGGTLNLNNTSDGAPYFGWQFGSLVTVSGTSASSITGLANTSARADLYSAAVGGTTFNIADATSNSSVDLTVSATLTDQGFTGSATAASLTKTGLGTMLLSSPNLYSGPTIINGGTLLVNNSSGSGTGNGGVAINSGGTLGGTGIIAGAVTNNAGGTLAPGTNGPGTLTISGDLRLNAGSTNAFDVNGSTLAKDTVTLGATVTYGGELKIIPVGTFAAGQSFTLFNGAGATNTSNFASINGNPGAGLGFTFTNGVLRVVNIVLPRPTLGLMSSSPTNLAISFPTVVGGTYVLQSATNLNPVIFWQNESTNAGTGENLGLNLLRLPGDSRKFFRVWIY